MAATSSRLREIIRTDYNQKDEDVSKLFAEEIESRKINIEEVRNKIIMYTVLNFYLSYIYLLCGLNPKRCYFYVNKLRHPYILCKDCAIEAQIMQLIHIFCIDCAIQAQIMQLIYFFCSKHYSLET